ncbi:uncharacterized protein [Dermacentor albipictus]
MDSRVKLRFPGDEDYPVAHGLNNGRMDNRAKFFFIGDKTVLAFHASSPGQASVQHGDLLLESGRQAPASVQRIPPCTRPWARWPEYPGRRAPIVSTGTPRSSSGLAACTSASHLETSCPAWAGGLRYARHLQWTTLRIEKRAS